MITGQTVDRDRHRGSGRTRARRWHLALALILASTTGCVGVELGVVGIERRPGADTELEIVGPMATADLARCTNPRFVDEPTTPAAIDIRCTPYGSH